MFDEEALMGALMTGFVTSGDTGNEDLVIASRAAMTEFCESSDDKRKLVCKALYQNLKAFQGQDRILVPTMEILAFLFNAGLAQHGHGLDCKQLCLQVQKAGYKTGNVRKLLACIKVYGGVAATASIDEPSAAAAGAEARKRLGALMLHPWPRVKSAVVDELWGLLGEKDGAGDGLLGVDWTKADKSQIKGKMEELCA
jgi:hypothetical protein